MKHPDRVRGLSLINDLSAVITAGDPSERRAKLFGIDRGRKPCKIVGFRIRRARAKSDVKRPVSR